MPTANGTLLTSPEKNDGILVKIIYHADAHSIATEIEQVLPIMPQEGNLINLDDGGEYSEFYHRVFSIVISANSLPEIYTRVVSKQTLEDRLMRQKVDYEYMDIDKKIDDAATDMNARRGIETFNSDYQRSK